MERERIIVEVINKLKNLYYNNEIEEYLQAAGVNEVDYASIINEANARIWEEKLAYYQKKNKRIFTLWLSLSIATFILFLFILPYISSKSNGTLLAVTGTVLLVFFSYLAMLYNKTWEVDYIKDHESPHISFGFLFIFLLPGFLFYYLLDWRFSNVSYNALKNTQEKATGTIISGKSLTMGRGGAIDFTDVTVQFQTKEGTTITATENISKYDFKKFYVGQHVDLLYSKEDPLNIDLLVDKSHVQDLAGSQERDITHEDLIRLLSVKKEDMLAELNKIKYGWEYDSLHAMWINNKANGAITVNENEINLIGPENIGYAERLKRAGFKRTDSANSNKAIDLFSTKPKTFEKDNYIATVQKIKDKTTFLTMITIQRK